MNTRRKLKVLVVDDDCVDRKIIHRTLHSQANDIDIIEAVSVREGLGLLIKESFDVIILDYRMPECNGIDMVKELRSRSDLGQVAIIMMSASESDEIAEACIEAGAQDFIVKSEIGKLNLQRALKHAQKRFELEHKLHQNYLNVKHLSEKDPLTGLSNRYHFNQILKLLLDEKVRSNNQVALILLDLDDFKLINDVMGHDVGDRLLIEFSKRIKQQLRRDETFARLGGDEFAIILNGISTEGQAEVAAKRICRALAKPMIINNTDLQCKASLGVALYPRQAKNKDELIRFADIAMYMSKRTGKGIVSVYKDEMQSQFSRPQDIQQGIKRVLESGNFAVQFQPVINLTSGQEVGYEALIRWPHESVRFDPEEFIPVAEKNSDIHEIGNWVIHQALHQIKIWQEKHPHLFVAINISPAQLQVGKTCEHLIKLVENFNLDPSTIVLEITETVLFENHKVIKSSLDKLSEFGFLISLDDFGVGYSSISHLINFPIDIVKLDKSLFSIDQCEKKRLAIFEALATMLKRLNMKVVAEGIETEEQLSLCKALSIDHGQGFLLSKPKSAEQIEAGFT